MLRLLEHLPVELAGANVLCYLAINDIIRLERASNSRKSHQLFQSWIPFSPPVLCKYSTIQALEWFSKRHCEIYSITIHLSRTNPGLYLKNLHVEYYKLFVDSDARVEHLNILVERNIGHKIKSIFIIRDPRKDVIETLSACTMNVKQLYIKNSSNYRDWLTIDILKQWRLKKVCLDGLEISPCLVLLIIQTCSELTSIKLYSVNIDDATVIAIAQHCTKLQTLSTDTSNITWTSLLTLSERGLPSKELDIPNIPTADIARRCSHALSYMRFLNTYYLHQNDLDSNILIPYMTGLTRVDFDDNCSHSYTILPVLTQYCHKITKIVIHFSNYTVEDILSLCCANPLLQELLCFIHVGITDTALIELIHACPHLHTLCLPFATDITDIGILALSEHCHQLQRLVIQKCEQVTEVAVLQLLQRCRKLTTLEAARSSLSEETWTQLDSNTQKRVSRC